MIHVLVTGAGALLGQGILRLLQVSDFEKKVFTADPDARSSGHWLGDHALWLPKASDKNFMEVVINYIKKYQIDTIMVGTDVELPLFAKHKDRLLEEYNCKVIVSNSEVVSISNDKFLTAKFLKENQFSYPLSVMANNKKALEAIKEQLGFPLFAKPADGARSLGIKKINNSEDLFELYHPDSNMVVQQFLSEDEGEYTSGCIVVNGECKAVVTLRRDLKDGNTYRAYRDENTSKYDHIIKDIAEKLNPDGPVNFQFRIYNNQPVVFEINGRFSGTTPLRHFFGFNEVEAIINYYNFNKEIEQPNLKSGLVMRVWSDIFIENEEMEKFKNDKEIEYPYAKFYNFKLNF
jgi:carbamoyl-phosphate synthase large subunit